MKPKLSLEEVRQLLFKKCGNQIRILEYTSMNKKSKFECENGHIWFARTASVIYDGNRCSICSKKKKYSYAEVKEYIENNNCILLSNEYVNTQTPLLIKLSCGHIRRISLSNFRKGRRCRICSWKRMGKEKRISMETILHARNSLCYQKK